MNFTSAFASGNIPALGAICIDIARESVEYLLLASERDTIRGVQIRDGAVYIYIYMWRYVCHNSSACHAYVMWVELGHYHFLYVPAVLNVVTTGNGSGTKNVLKWNRALGFASNLLSTALLL